MNIQTAPNEIKAQRVFYLDLIKAVSVFLVVFCHNPALDPNSVSGNILMVLAFAACPLFFLCSGAVMIASGHFHWGRWARRLTSTYAVLVVWKFAYLLFFRWLSGASWTALQIVNYLFLFGSLEHVATAHFWFMHAYLVLLLLLPMTWQLYHSGRDGKRALLLMALFSYIGSSYIFSPNLPSVLIGKLPGMAGFSLAPTYEVQPFGSHSNMIVYFVLGPFLFDLPVNFLSPQLEDKCPPCGDSLPSALWSARPAFSL